MDADTVYRWAQALALIAALATTWLTIVRLVGEDRLVKRQMGRLDELEKVASAAPDDLTGHVQTLQREVVADYLATVMSGSWNRIGVAKLPMAGTAAALAMFSILTGALIASPVIGMGLRNTGILIPFSLIMGIVVAGVVGWLALGPVLGRRMLREELHRRFTRRVPIEGAVEEFDLPEKKRRGGNIVGAGGAVAMFLGLTAGTVAALSLIVGKTQTVLTGVSVMMMLIAVSLSLSILIVVSRGPEKYGGLALK